MTRFHSLTNANPVIFTRLEAITPMAGKPGFYPGVLIIQKGPAKGHFAVEDSGRVMNYNPDNPAHAELQRYQIVIGDVTLDDVARCGAEEENSKCKLDHGSTVRDVVGSYATFRREGDQVRADLTLMVSSQYREYVEELFAKFAKKVGNSIDFDSSYEIQGSIAVARCVKLYSVDIVDAPAATNSLFNEPTNQLPTEYMPLSKEDLDAIGSTVDSKIESRFSKMEKDINTRFEEVKTKMEEGEEDDKDKKKNEDDKEDKTEMSAVINKAVLSAIQAVLPKATVDNLTALAARSGDVKDEYAEKHSAAKALGMSEGQATTFMAKKHPLLFNAKFGNGGGQKGSATGSTKL